MQTFDFSSEGSFISDVKEKFSYIKEFGLNTLIVQVRPFADAIYPSEIFPMSEYVFKDKIPEFDVLEIMINTAKEFGLSFHAWINPYRISNDNKSENLNPLSPAMSFIENDAEDVAITDKGIYFNPASLSAQKLIIDGVRELIEHYDVDAVHIDDYFYPTVDESFDSTLYEKYVGSGGKLSLSDWRRENVNSLVSGIYSAVKNYNPDILFGISPGGNIDYNYNNLFADVKLWCSSVGYIDYIIPQIYFGFDNSNKPFKETAEEWSSLINNNIKLYCGLALYKSGVVDEFCKDEISRNEWVENNDIIKRQIEFIRKIPVFSGFALFSFRNLSVFSNKNLKIEVQNIRNVL